MPHYDILRTGEFADEGHGIEAITATPPPGQGAWEQPRTSRENVNGVNGMNGTNGTNGTTGTGGGDGQQVSNGDGNGGGGMIPIGTPPVPKQYFEQPLYMNVNMRTVVAVAWWWTGTAMFLQLQNGSIAARRRDGQWRVYRPKKMIVVSNNPRVRTLDRANKKLKDLMAMLPGRTTRSSPKRRRAPRGRTSSIVQVKN